MGIAVAAWRVCKLPVEGVGDKECGPSQLIDLCTVKMPLAAMVCDVHGVVALARTEEGADSDGAPLHTQRISLAAHELSRSMALLAPLSARAFQSEQRDGLLLFGMRDGGEQTFVCIGSRPERSFAAFALLGEMAALWRCRHAYSDTEWSAQLRSALLGHAAALYEGAPPPSARALASPHSSPHSSHLCRLPRAPAPALRAARAILRARSSHPRSPALLQPLARFVPFLVSCLAFLRQVASYQGAFYLLLLTSYFLLLTSCFLVLASH